MKLFVAFLGLSLGIYVTFHPTIIAIVICNLLALFIYYRFGLKSVLVYYLLFVIGIISILFNANYEQQDQYRGLVIEAKENYFIFQYRFQRFYIYQPSHNFQTGDLVIITGEVKPLAFTKIESRFDFLKYLNNKGINTELNVTSIETIFTFPIRRILIIDRFIGRLPTEVGLLTKSLLFGSRSYDSEIIVYADKYNLLYLLTLSGVPIHFACSTMEDVFSSFVSRKMARVFVIVLLIPYVLINMNSIPLMRIYIGKIINSVNETINNNKASYWQRKGLLGIILLIFSRYIVNSPSFYLGFGLSTTLYLCWPLLKSFRGLKRYIIRQVIIWGLILPYLIVNNYEINIISYLLIIPIMFLANWLFLISLLQLYVMAVPFLSRPFLTIIEIIFSFADQYQWTIVVGALSGIVIIIYLLNVINIIHLFQKRQNRSAYKFSLLAIFSFSVLTLPVESFYIQRVSFINVGQGDAILIQDRRTNVLIDTGGNFFFDIATESLIPYFKKHKISTIDTLIITHDDFDHSGGMDSLIANFNVKRLLTHYLSFPLSIGSLTLENLNIDTSEHIDNNEASLVLYFNFIGHQWLLMGDASKVIEHSIMDNYPNLEVDYIKIGHHGSKTSTCETFIEAITPKEAIISVGRNNYGHPNEEVLAILKKHNVSIRRTDLEGTITYQKTFF